MPAKTIYIRDESQWNQVKELAGDEGFSALIQRLLADWLRKHQQRGKDQFGEVKLWVGGKWHEEKHDSQPHYISFTGRQIADNETAFSDRGELLQPMPVITVYGTKSGALIVYRDWRPTAEEWGATFQRFSDFEALQRYGGVFDTTWIDSEGEFSESTEAEHDTMMRAVADALGELPTVWLD